MIILSSSATDDFVECSRRHVKTTGTLFKKQIFRWGPFAHPSNPDIKINVDEAFYKALKRNFDNGVCPIVQVPLVDDQNRHTEAPEKNIGEVVDLASDDEGVYAYIDVRRHADDVGEVILGASAKMSLDYVDNRTNTHVGPTLLHVAATNRPYLVNLSDFEKSVSLSNADTSENTVLLTNVELSANRTNSEEETSMTKEEMILALSAEYDIDVVAGQKALTQVEGFVALSDVIGGDVDVNPASLSSAIVELTNSVSARDTEILELKETLQTVQLSNAETEVDGLIAKARIRPAVREEMIELSVNNRKLFEAFLVPEEDASVELSEVGFTTAETSVEVDPAEAARLEGARLANLTK